MQQRIGERVETKFVPYPQVEPLKQKLEERDAKKKLLEELEQFAEKLVKSSKPFGLHLFIEGKNILEDYRMDLLSTEERRRALNEAKAISLCEWSKEELDSTNEIDEKWVNGEITHKEWRERLFKSL